MVWGNTRKYELLRLAHHQKILVQLRNEGNSRNLVALRCWCHKNSVMLPNGEEMKYSIWRTYNLNHFKVLIIRSNVR